MFTIKYGKEPTQFHLDYADKVVEYDTPAGRYIMLYRYPTGPFGGESIVETRINLDDECKALFVENMSGKTVQRFSAK